MAHWLREEYHFTTGDWYRPYSSLNNMKVPPSPAVLKQIQIDAIRQNNSKLSAEIEHLNSFLAEFQAYAKRAYRFDEEQDFFTVLSKKINAGYGFFDAKDLQNIKLKDLTWLDRYLKSVKNLTNLIKQYSGKEIPPNIKQAFTDIEQHIRQGKYHSFRARKAQLWEDISEWVLSIAGFQSIGTGAIIDAGGKQLIQDTIAYLASTVHKKPMAPKDGLSVSVRFTGEQGNKDSITLEKIMRKIADEKIANTITFGPEGYVNVQVQGTIEGWHDFINQVSHEAQRKITIKINDDTQDYLSNFLSVQAKSGLYQPLLNNEKRDLIDISTLSAWDKYLATLNKFYNNFSQNKKVDEGTSKTLGAYTNWVFSKNIAKTTLGKNTFFLSHHGFSTLDQTMEKDKFYFRLSPNPKSLKLLSSRSFAIAEAKDVVEKVKN